MITAGDFRKGITVEWDNGVWNIDWAAGISATFPGVSSYNLAPEDQGGDGMTQVFFR